MTLHIDDHLEKLAHQRSLVNAVSRPLWVVEQYLHQTLGVGVPIVELSDLTPVDVIAALLHFTFPFLVQIILKGLAHIVVDAGGGVGSHQLLTLCLHRQDATDNHRATGIDGYVLGEEDLWEVLGDATANAVMLALAYGSQLAQSLIGGDVELLQLVKHPLALLGQLAVFATLLQRTQHTVVVILADEPA